MSKKNTDFITKTFGCGYSSSYPSTQATLIKNKIDTKVEAEKGDLVLLVTKEGYECTQGHVGLVLDVRAKHYEFETLVNGKKKKFKLPFNFLAKRGMVTVGFYTVK